MANLFYFTKPLFTIIKNMLFVQQIPEMHTTQNCF